MNIEKQIRQDTPQVSVAPYKQIHAHSTGNPSSTAQNEADYMNRKDLSSGFFTHVVGNGRIIQTAITNRGAWDVGGSWNNKTYAAVELIESHKTQAEFDRDYKLYVELLRQLAKENGIPIQVDCGVEGINTHYYCTYNQPGNKSDHIDPYPYLKKWGISKAQFKKDVENGETGEIPSSPNISNPPTPSVRQIAVDRIWGKDVTSRLQEINGLIVDGEVWHQYKTDCNKAIPAFKFDNSLKGSPLIRVIQQQLGVKPADGLAGKDTFKAMAKKLGTYPDGVVWFESPMVGEMQELLNKNINPFK